MKFSDIHEGKTVIHVVGGAMTEELKSNLPTIAEWFVKNDITMLWGDDYEAKTDKKHPCKILEDLILEMGGNKPIRVLQIGKDYEATLKTQTHLLGELRDEVGIVIGYYDCSANQPMIYTHQQQDRQKAYYNIADGLLALNGGIGVGYEIINSLLYTLSGDLPKNFRIIVLDEKEKFKKLMDSYVDLIDGGAPELKARFFEDYYATPTDFVQHVLDEETTI